MEGYIVRISPDAPLPIRHQVMWPDKSIEYVKLPNDKDGIHLGLMIQEQLVSVISVFITNTDAQFRKLATLFHHQKKGYGTRLLTAAMDIAQQHGCHRIWCNARIQKHEFYAKFGMTSTPIRFTKGGISYLVMEKTL